MALDLLDIAPIAGVEFIHLDFLAPDAPERIKALLNGPADIVLSDMAANATGHRKTDHIRIMALAEAAAEFAREVLAPGGAFLCKVLQGGTESTLLAALKRDFASVKHVKPAASRSDSAELYLLATGFRGTDANAGAAYLTFWSVISVGPGSGARRDSSAPASTGMRKKKKDEQAEISAMMI